MRIFYAIAMLIIGFFLGSFYGCIGYRIPNKISIVKPGSRCDNCLKPLKWYMLQQDRKGRLYLGQLPGRSFVGSSFGFCQGCMLKIRVNHSLQYIFKQKVCSEDRRNNDQNGQNPQDTAFGRRVPSRWI